MSDRESIKTFSNEIKYINTLYTYKKLLVAHKKCSQIPFSRTKHSTRAFCQIGYFHFMRILKTIFFAEKKKNDSMFCVNIVTFLHNLAVSIFNARQPIPAKLWNGVNDMKLRKMLQIFILF